MKNRFGNVTYDSTLSQGLYPFKWDTDTLAHSVSSFTFEVQEGTVLNDTASTSLPTVLSIEMPTVVAYRDANWEDTASAALPSVLSIELVTVVTYQSVDLPDDTVSASLPTMTITMPTVVRIQTLYDGALDRPEDTLQHTYSMEFTVL